MKRSISGSWFGQWMVPVIAFSMTFSAVANEQGKAAPVGSSNGVPSVSAPYAKTAVKPVVEGNTLQIKGAQTKSNDQLTGIITKPKSQILPTTPPAAELVTVPYGEDVVNIRDGVAVEPVGIRQSMLLAINNSPALDAARARYEQAKGKTNEAYTGGNPTLSFGAGYTHVLPEASSSLGEAKITTIYEHSYDASLTLNQTIATFGRLHYAVLAAHLNECLVQEQYRQSLETVLANTADMYLACLMADEEVRIADQLLEARNAALKDAESLFSGGTVAKFDVLRYRSEATTARQRLIEAQNARQLAYARLCSVMGFPQGTQFELRPLNMAVVPANLVEHVDFAARVEEALLCRPELRALSWAREASVAKLDLVKSSRNPIFALQSGVTHKKATSMAPSTLWTTALVLSVPILDGGVEKAQAEQLEAAIKEIDANYRDTERQVRLDVESCFLNLSSRWERIIQATSGLEQATEACRVAEVRYAAGLSTSTELLDAQTALAQARQALVVARYGYLAANVQWARAISGQYPVDVPGPIDPAAIANKGNAWYLDLDLPIFKPQGAVSPDRLEIKGGGDSSLAPGKSSKDTQPLAQPAAALPAAAPTTKSTTP